MKEKNYSTKINNNKSNGKKNDKSNGKPSNNGFKSNTINTSEKENKKNEKENKQNKKETILNLFYMTPNEINARQLYDLVGEQDNLVTELWEAMNIFQIELPNMNTADFESIEPIFKDPSDQSFLNNRNIKTIFAVTTMLDDFDTLKPIFKMILNKYDGFFCTDSDDFKPIYNSENL